MVCMSKVVSICMVFARGSGYRTWVAMPLGSEGQEESNGMEAIVYAHRQLHSVANSVPGSVYFSVAMQKALLCVMTN